MCDLSCAICRVRYVVFSSTEGHADGNRSKNNLNIVHINASSLLNSFDKIKLLLRENDINVLCVSETWLDSYLPDRFIYVEGNNVFRTDAGQGGGTWMFKLTDRGNFYILL